MKKKFKVRVVQRMPNIILEFTGFNNNTVRSLVQLNRGNPSGKSTQQLHEERMLFQGRGVPNTDISSGVKNKALYQNLKNEGKAQAEKVKEQTKAEEKRISQQEGQ